jgi:RHS repeat-associated protein
VPQSLWYAGYLYDRELKTPGEISNSGWYWLSVRSYDPVLERFLQPDPSGQEGTRSYVYCNDDSLDCTDPSGLLSWSDVGSWVHNTLYNTAQGAAGGLDFLSFGGYAHLAGAFGARVDTNSTAYEVGFWATGAFPLAKGGLTLGKALLSAPARARTLSGMGVPLGSVTSTVRGVVSLPAGEGATDAAGNVSYSILGSLQDENLAKYHELVHSWLTPRFGPFVAFRQAFRLGVYKNSQLATFAEESLAETHGQIRAYGFNWSSLGAGPRLVFGNPQAYGVTASGLLQETAYGVGAGHAVYDLVNAGT